MKFKALPTAAGTSNFTLIYRADECSFDTDPAPIGAFTSVLLDDLSLEIDACGRIISVWGLCPYTRWKRASLVRPREEVGDVFFMPDGPLVRGVSIQVNKSGYWPVYVDPSSGWVRVTGEFAAALAVNILPGVTVEITSQGDIAALWLKPKTLPDLEL
jgi:hypothetical protein